MKKNKNILRYIIFPVVLFVLISPFDANRTGAQEKATLPPGVIVTTSPDFQDIYTSAPSLAILPDGTYLLSHTWAGKKAGSRRTLVFESNDKGKYWTKISEVPKMFWPSLFYHRGAVYLFGTYDRAQWAIVRSDDRGRTWTVPTDSKNGLLQERHDYSTAPGPVVFHRGKIWRSSEHVRPPRTWGICSERIMCSIPENEDLLDASKWTYSNVVPYPENWHGSGWIEGNAVPAPDGSMVDISRINLEGADKAAIVQCSEDGKTLTVDPETAMIDFPGGAVKFLIRYDEKTKRYWSLSNPQTDPRATRNVLALVSSEDLRTWTINCIVLRHYDRKHHAWQYVDWVFDGDDLIYASRTAWDGSHDMHDANYLTFHRLENFRDLTRKDDASWFGDYETAKKETDELIVEVTLPREQQVAFGTMRHGDRAFANRSYVWKDVTPELDGLQCVRNYAGQFTDIRVTAKKDTVVMVGRNSRLRGVDCYRGWEFVGENAFSFTEEKATPFFLYRVRLRRGENLGLPFRYTWPGDVLMFSPSNRSE